MDLFDFDIETIPSQLPWVREYYEETTKHPKTLKKQESIDAWYGSEKQDAAIDAAVEKASYSGASNHILCISYCVNDRDIHCLSVDEDPKKLIDSEKRMLQDFFKLVQQLNAPTYRGHNIVGFDLRVIKQRAMVLGVPIPRAFPTDPRPWDKNVYDTMLKWDSRDFIKMDLIARAMGIDGKGAVDGSMVYPMWKEGRLKEICEYCNDDVRMGRDVANRMMFIDV